MVAYSFQRQFVEPILWGRKQNTIRRLGRRRHARPGDVLQLYIGMRTRQCRLILTTRCADVLDVRLRWRPRTEVIVAGAKVAVSDLDDFARRDGFSDFEAMQRFWADTHSGVDVFDGPLIAWLPPRAPVEMGTNLLLAEAA